MKNPRSWKEKEWKDEDLDQFKMLAEEVPVSAHLSYLPNIAKTDEDERHIKGFMHEAELCTQLGIGHITVHCGSRKDRAKGINMAAWAINMVLEKYSELSILLENAAGQGDSLGRNIPELAAIFAKVKNRDRIFLCLDTAHLFESGYDIRTIETWDLIMLDISRDFGEDKVLLFHINDSRTRLGSNIDRHWHVGKGEIGIDAFKLIVNNKSFAHLSGVMETPKVGKMDEENMRVMRSLLSPLMPRSFS